MAAERPPPDPRPIPMRRPSSRVVVPLILVLAVLAAAVVWVLGRRDDDNANGSVPVRSVAELGGRWAAVNAVGAPNPLAAPVELEVDGDRLLVRTGCNTGSGTVSVEDSRLVLDGEGLAVTEMGCDAPRTAQEAWVVDMLGATPRLELSGPYLYVTWGPADRWWLGLEQVADPT